MKILYYFANDGTPMWTWQEYHIFNELNHHGIEIIEFNPNDFSSPAEANEYLIKKLKESKYDLFMTVHGSKELFPETMVRIKELGLPRVLINFDNKMDPRRHIDFSKYFDVIMLLNIDNDPAYKHYKCPYVFAPYAANPYYFKDLRKEAIHGICFVGTPYGTRCRPINVLTGRGIPFDLYANESHIVAQREIGSGMNVASRVKAIKKMLESKSGIKVLESALICKLKSQEILDVKAESLHVSPGVNHAEMNRLYSNYALSISMPEARNTGVLKNPVDIVRLRNFEIPMCAGLQITRFYQELSDFFEEDKEIIFYRSNEELIDKVKFYTDSKNSTIVERMKTAARIRCENEHTWYLRFKKVFDSIGVNI